MSSHYHSKPDRFDDVTWKNKKYGGNEGNNTENARHIGVTYR